MKRFSESHEWIEVKGSMGTVGITAFAQGELGDIVFVELPDLGGEVKAQQEAVVLESTKAAADVYAPVSGRISEVNKELINNPGLVNSAPDSDGWLYKIEIANPAELDDLLDEAGYAALVQ